ncbi:HEPN domain-containing protein [bacterium]|nr:HEPN domain-containing protein [bacterium]
MKQITKEWLSAAKDDLIVIEKIIDDDLLSHVVAFHAQQCIEKVFKAVIEEYEMGLVKVHNLIRLHELVIQHLKIKIDMSMLEKLDKLYIDSRYPGDLGLLPNGKPSLKDANEFYEISQKVYEYVEEIMR